MEKRGKIVYNAYDLKEILGISQTSAYNLMHSKGFPSFRLGRSNRSSLVVREADLNKWIESQITKKK